jgi:hypothetical protein
MTKGQLKDSKVFMFMDIEKWFYNNEGLEMDT